MLNDDTMEALARLAKTDGFAATVSACSRLRISCEGWLKVELLKLLSNRLPDAELKPELEFTDIVVRAGEEEVLVELKSFPTNYGGAGKPITNFVGGVIEDIKKLQRKCDSQRKSGIAVFVAYPIPPDANKKWTEHLVRIQTETGLLPSELHCVALQDAATARLYAVGVN